MAEPTGLRERKKRRTREAIVRAAIALFTEQGCQGTTGADIAAAPEVATSSVFASFPTTDDGVFHASASLRAGYADRLERRPPEESALADLRDRIARAFPDASSAKTRSPTEVVDGDERPLAQGRYRLGSFEGVLAVDRDLDGSPAAPRPRPVVGAAIGALAALPTHERTEGRLDERQELAAALGGTGLAAVPPPDGTTEPPPSPVAAAVGLRAGGDRGPDLPGRRRPGRP